ncbi:MAG: hypothetical protein IPO19_14030 [Rhodoferax sp.]|nr:hypothetical protein [Rhodoferax sp.]
MRCEIAELRAQVALLQRAPRLTDPTLPMTRPARKAWLRRVIDKISAD